MYHLETRLQWLEKNGKYGKYLGDSWNSFITDSKIMEPRSRLPFAEQVHAARFLVDNALANSEIIALMAPFGYSAPQIQALIPLIETAESQISEQDSQSGSRTRATAALVDSDKDARSDFQEVAQIARVVFASDKTRLAELGIVGVTPRSVAGFLQRAQGFLAAYRSHPEIATALAARSVTAQRLATLEAKLDALLATDEAQQRQKGEAMQATQRQNAALKALNDAIGPLARYAKIALKERPDLLKALGL